MGWGGKLAIGVASFVVMFGVVVPCGLSFLFFILPQTGHVVRSSEITANATSSASNRSPTPLAAQAEARSGETMPPSALATASAAPKALPGRESWGRELQTAALSQVSPSTNPNLPTEVLIKRRTSTTEYNAPGDVEVVYKDGTSRSLTDGETSSQAKFSSQNGTIGWVVNEAPTDHPGDGYTMSYEVRPSHTLVLCP